MADATPEPLQEQYAAIELLYSAGRWPEVLAAADGLLADLPPLQGEPLQDGPLQAQSLRSRLQLLIAHTLLYGQGDPQGAEQRYRAVLVESDDAVVREIAEQGLLRCGEQRAPTAEQDPMANAMPWLADLAPAPAGAAISSAADPPLPLMTATATARETLALLRVPDPLPTDRGLEWPQGLEPSQGPDAPQGPEQERNPLERGRIPPEPAAAGVGGPPLGPEAVAELARGLLEVALD
jgi:hypothetical protein